MKVIELNKVATASNDRDAVMLREELKARDLFLINLMSAAGSGKTTLLSRTIQDLKGQVPIGVMEADIASDVDAAAIERLGARSIQVHTGGCCHMDASMTRQSLEAFGAESGMDFRDTCALAMAFSAAAVTTPGTQPAEMEVVNALLKQVRLSEM